jgi:Homing endonuclease associated repeat
MDLPMSALELRSKFERLRDDPASRRMDRHEAWCRWFHQACLEGNPPDALRRYSRDEAERFWAQVVEGTDGHLYWTGAHLFRTNEGRVPKPARWLWQRRTGRPLARTTLIVPGCGEPNCINSEHARLLSPSEYRTRRFGEQQMIGRLQVVAMQLGRTPTSMEWRERNERPSETIYRLRFGSWARACEAAGLEPVSDGSRSAEDVIIGLRALAEHLGHPPSHSEFVAQREWLKARGHPSSHYTVYKRLGVVGLGRAAWPTALRQAGLLEDE